MLQANLIRNAGPAEAAAEGFETAEDTLPILQVMQATSPYIVAKQANKIIGYTLVATTETYRHHQLISGLFEAIDDTEYNGGLLQREPYVVVGQVCVAKAFRGQWLVKKLYSITSSSMPLYTNIVYLYRTGQSPFAESPPVGGLSGGEHNGL
jgi:hypothetical protein